MHQFCRALLTVAATELAPAFLSGLLLGGPWAWLAISGAAFVHALNRRTRLLRVNHMDLQLKEACPQATTEEGNANDSMMFSNSKGGELL